MKYKISRLESLIKNSNEKTSFNLKLYLFSNSSDLNKIKNLIRDLLGDVEISHHEAEYEKDILIFNSWFEAKTDVLTLVVFYEKHIYEVIRRYVYQIMTKINYDLKEAFNKNEIHRIRGLQKIKKLLEGFDIQNLLPYMSDFKEFKFKMENLFKEEIENLWAEKDIDFYDDIKYDDGDYKELLEFDQFLSYLEDVEWLIAEENIFDFELFSYPEDKEEE